MNLDELLKVNTIRCIETKVDEDLVEGEIYKVEGFNDETIKIVDCNGFSNWYNKNLFEPVLNNDIDLDELVNHLVVGKSWKEVGCNHVVTITEISSDFANSTMVAFESDCCLSSSPLGMFLKDFTPVINNDVSKSNNEIDISLNSVNDVNNVNTTFKVGDKVYVFGSGEIHTIIATVSPHHALLNNTSHPVSMETLTLANDYSYNMLTQLFENIVFEPPKR